MRTWILSALLLPLLWVMPACNSSGGGTAVVTLDGQALLVIGIQSQLAATTTNGGDTAYTWQSLHPAIATVDPVGMVTARAAGEATIQATGNRTGASGSFKVVVVANPTVGVPNFAGWESSPHNLKTAEAFTHWDGDGAIPASCAKCHSTHGFRDFLGDDGSPAGTVESAAALGTTVECQACHNPSTEALDSVTFPSGVTIQGLGREATCMQCHQGRSSTESVDDAIAAANPPTVDTPMPDRGFINIHYFPAGATRYAGEVDGGYTYDGKDYDVLLKHVPGYVNCQDCHDPHTTKIKIQECAQCHNVSTQEDLKNIRAISSVLKDYDGDGNRVEGLYFEIDTLRNKLLQAIQAYAMEVQGQAIAYDGGRYPYFFKDTNGNGVADAGEANFGNRFTSFTARLLKATYNYQYAVKDPGGFAHNGKFIIQLLHDSIEDLNGAITNKVDMTGADRNDMGHFDGTASAFRHWDDDGAVSASCARCHGASAGLDEFLTYGVNTPKPIQNGMDCASCHTTFDTFETRRIPTVTFPGGKQVKVDASVATSAPEMRSQICLMCHQGRESKKTIDDAIAAGSLSFKNVHYLAAGATLFGTEVQVGYEYTEKGKTYVGKFDHFGEGTQSHHCTFCHSPTNTRHSFQPQDNLAFCKQCHDVDDVHDIRLNRPLDYDGDGNTTERLSDEIDTMAAALLARISAVGGVVYNGDRYPYFFKDNNPPNGVADPLEISFGNRFTAWTPALIKAAHNYQHSQKEHGAWAHNFYYIIQLLYDSIEDLGGDVSAYTRPS